MKMYSKEGDILMDTRSVRREKDVLIMKGKMIEARKKFYPVRLET